MNSSIDEQKIRSYLQDIEKEQNKKERIKKLTETLMEKTKMKLKLSNKEAKREEQFNKKLEEMRQLSTFVDARPLINKLNLLNDRKLLIKMEVIQKTQQYQEKTQNNQNQQNQNVQLLNPEPLVLDEEFKLQFLASQNYEPIQKKELKIPKRVKPESPKGTDPVIIGDDLFNFESTPKNDSNLFYRSIFKTSSSPLKQQQIKQYEEETQKVKQFLLSQGLIDKTRNQKNQRRVPLGKVPIQQYYQNFQLKCQDLVKDIVLESKRRSLQMNETEVSRRESAADTFRKSRNSTKMGKHSSRISQSQNNQSLSQMKLSHPVGSQTHRTFKRTNSIDELEKNSPVRSRLQTQFETFTQAVNSTQMAFSKINRENRKIIRRMSTAVSSVHKKYKDDE